MEHICDWCDKPGIIQCPTGHCMHHLCEDCERIHLFCRSHAYWDDVPVDDDLNAFREVAEAALSAGQPCPACEEGRIRVVEDWIQHDAIGVANARALECDACSRRLEGMVYWNQMNSPLTPKQLRRWKILLGQLDGDVRRAQHVWQALLGDKVLAVKLANMLRQAKDRLYRNVIVEEPDADRI